MSKVVLRAIACMLMALTMSAAVLAQDSTDTSTYFVDHDPGVIAAKAALDETMTRYDARIAAILTPSQQVDWGAMQRHGDWWWSHTMTDRNGYLAYLFQRLHLNAAQENEVSLIERQYEADIMARWTAYEAARKSAYEAWVVKHQIVIVERTTTTVTTPIVVETRRETAPPPPAPAPAPAPPQKKFIRNTDQK